MAVAITSSSQENKTVQQDFDTIEYVGSKRELDEL